VSQHFAECAYCGCVVNEKKTRYDYGIYGIVRVCMNNGKCERQRVLEAENRQRRIERLEAKAARDAYLRGEVAFSN